MIMTGIQIGQSEADLYIGYHVAVKTIAAACAVLMTLLMPVSVHGQQPPAAAEGENAELAKKLSNPVSDLVSLPFQLNWEQGVGPNDQTRFILNIQPVMPFSLNQDWNMIARVIMPFISQPPLGGGTQAAFGVGDILTSIFFSPTKGSIIWGLGPALSLPSTTQPTLGTEKWSAGPTIVVLKQAGPWTYGALWNQVWSFAGNSARDNVNQMFFQPFVAYNTKTLWTITLQSESTANWKASDQKWTVPINLLFAKLSSFGVFPASYQIGIGGFAVHPDLGPKWKIRAALVILLPRRR
jgi:hypothetical protein